MRIAGVYAFAALANDAPDARQGCIDVLCAYLRQPHGDPDAEDHRRVSADPPQAGRDHGQERQVRLTIIRLIRDNLHLPDDDPRTWRGHDFTFTGAVLDGGDFSGAAFTGEGTVTFAGATITGPLSFAGASFAGGTVSFDRARFAGGSVSFHGARFTGGVVDLSTVDESLPPPADALWPGGTAVPAGLRLPPAAGGPTTQPEAPPQPENAQHEDDPA
ncbi:pentapeptide repeat-containing protein [Actinokineospora sp. 24-640]